MLTLLLLLNHTSQVRFRKICAGKEEGHPPPEQVTSQLGSGNVSAHQPPMERCFTADVCRFPAWHLCQFGRLSFELRIYSVDAPEV